MGMDRAPIGKALPLALNGTREEIGLAVRMLLEREKPSSFAVTADTGKEGCILRLSKTSYAYLIERLEKEQK